MVTAMEVGKFRSAIGQLTTVAFAQTKALLAEVGDANPVVFRDRLLETFPSLVAPYHAAASELSATWYEDLRADMVGGSFTASVVSDVDPDRVDSLVRYSMTPLFQGSSSDVLGLLAGGLQRIVANGARDTIIQNVMADRVRVGYARIPRAGCCAFCGMLASRGAVYNSRESAGGVVGRGVDASVTAGKRGGQGKGVKVRGSRSLGSDRYHDHCHCLPAPVFSGDTFHKEVEDKYAGMYEQASGTKLSDYSKRNPDGPQFQSTDAKATLANWREEFGTK